MTKIVMSGLSKKDEAYITRGHEDACRELERTPRHMLDEGNPNHPQYDLHLFGVPAAQFMARQYAA